MLSDHYQWPIAKATFNFYLIGYKLYHMGLINHQCQFSGRRYSQIPSNDEHSEYSVYSYCGDNFPRPEKRSSRSGTVDTQISITSDELPPNLPRRCHRPFFITVVTIVHCALLIYVCVVGGIEDISFSPFVMSESVNTFGFIANNNNDSMHKEKVSRYSGVNAFIGPNSSFLVTVGAKFGPVSLLSLLVSKFVILKCLNDNSPLMPYASR